MRPGAGKNKGNRWERTVCRLLSLWVTKGASDDCFWRSSISGGRATIAHASGKQVRQCGDICSVSPEGHALTNHWIIEIKHYKDLEISAFLLSGKGKLAGFWQKLLQEAVKHQLQPMLIAKQNNRPSFVITERGSLVPFGVAKGLSVLTLNSSPQIDIHHLATMLSTTFQRTNNDHDDYFRLASKRLSKGPTPTRVRLHDAPTTNQRK